jgi:hypothetical protein
MGVGKGTALTICGTRRMFGQSLPIAEVTLGMNMVSATVMVSGFM